ncbi:alpha/beta hydrolase [Thiocystis violacea]|uniref:alpha/beta hydrolase n=1 Tax=Thiocystis violacea TaxID=13725 RepID=UPI0031F856D1
MLKGRLTIDASPEDRALLVSRWLFRSRHRVGQLRPEDISAETQRYFATAGRLDLIAYEGKRTDFFGHSYFTTNPAVSSIASLHHEADGEVLVYPASGSLPGRWDRSGGLVHLVDSGNRARRMMPFATGVNTRERPDE